MPNKHWAEQLADEIAEKKKPPFVIGSGITTSGPAHMGTLCEFLYPSRIRDMLEKGGNPTQFNFMADILDAFDSIPLSMQQYEKELAPHLGKPLCDVPDPSGKSGSFGDHFLDEVREVMRKFGIGANVIRMNELYASGRMDRYAKFFLENELQAKEIIERSSGREEKKGWSAIMPICGKCGKIATTRVLSHDAENYEYSCDRDVKYVKGCGFAGRNSIYDHKYKLMWRLDWPARQDLFETSCEGAGMDHFTKGGSRDTLEAIFKEMFKKEPSIGYKFGFILFQGKKYSKSKGIGMGVTDLMALLPPEVITFVLTRPDLEENKDISPTKESMVKMVEEYEQSQGFADKGFESLDRAERKRALAYLLAGKRHWKIAFRDIMMYHSVHQDWDKVGALVGDVEGVRYLKPYLEEWKTRDFIPDEFNFIYRPKKAEGSVRELFSSLADGMDADGIQNAVFEFAKSKNIPPAEFFRQIYLTLIGKERGPRLGKFIFALGVASVKKDVL
ncbi:Lysine--tRNA ligase [uncultured archaeon]|nr:Lysine--tRNA ligase [uncultured archaeon]